jgi:protein tyrosine/serine phosphatase
VLVKALLLALLLIAGAETARVALGSNFHTVVAGRCYRCAQPSGADLPILARTLGIRSIVNLRGFDERSWYSEERATAERLGITFADAGIWAASPATEAEFLNVVRAVDESPEPILIHCQSGSDRSGLAAAIFLLLKTDATVDQACGQLSLRFGHNPWGRAACQDRILAAYVAWLAQHGWTHAPERFRAWARDGYRQENGI